MLTSNVLSNDMTKPMPATLMGSVTSCYHTLSKSTLQSMDDVLFRISSKLVIRF